MKHLVARADEVGKGQRKLVHVKGRPVLIFNLDGEYFGMFARCPHRGGDLSAGCVGGLILSDVPGEYRFERPGEFIRCPWHGWEFDIRTGQSWCRPDDVKARPYQVRVENGAELVEGPYVAETVPVSADGEYLVIEA